MVNRLLKIISVGASAILVSCSSKPLADSAHGFKLNTKAKVTNKVNNESYGIDLEFLVLPERALRIDVTALLGYRVAELVMSPQQIQYISREDKTFVQGPYKAKTLQALFRQPVDPRLIWGIAHGLEINDGVYAGSRFTTEQTGNVAGYATKRVTLENKQFKMIWLFKSREPIDLSYTETFVLPKPEDYKLISIK